MAQKVTGYIKLQIEAGKATPAPPVGPALGQKGVLLYLSPLSEMLLSYLFGNQTSVKIFYIADHSVIVKI